MDMEEPLASLQMVSTLKHSFDFRESGSTNCSLRFMFYFVLPKILAFRIYLQPNSIVLKTTIWLVFQRTSRIVHGYEIDIVQILIVPRACLSGFRFRVLKVLFKSVEDGRNIEWLMFNQK